MDDPNALNPNADPAAAAADAPQQAFNADDTRPYEPLDEEMVAAVAMSMAKAHHGPDVQGSGGYMEAARTFVAGAMAIHEYGAPRRPTENPPPVTQ